MEFSLEIWGFPNTSSNPTEKKTTNPVDFTARLWMTSGNFGNDMGI